jgi:hypothetical protein
VKPDPRLASPVLLALAGLRAKERQRTGGVVRSLPYAAIGQPLPDDALLATIFLPDKAPSADAWYASVAALRAPLTEGDQHGA